MAIVVAPVWVVIVVVGEPVSLVGCCSLCRALCRIAPCGEAQGVTVVPLLLHTEVVRQSIVEGSLYITAVCPTIGKTR